MNQTKNKSHSVDDYRETLEAYLGKQLTFLQWRRYSTEFIETGLPLNINNLKLFANFKRVCPRKLLTKQALDSLKNFQNQHRTKEEWLGFEVEQALRKLDPAIAPWRVYRAFYRAGLGFKAQERYEQKEVWNVVFYALVYGGKSERTISN